MSSPAALRKQLKIKTGSVKRLIKEHKLYIKELEVLRLELDKLVEGKADDWAVKNAKKMVEEGNKMVAHGQSLTSKASAELEELLISAREDTEVKDDDPEVVAAKEALSNFT